MRVFSTYVDLPGEDIRFAYKTFISDSARRFNDIQIAARPCNYRVKLQLCWPAPRMGYNNARRDISLSFYALLTIACLEREFRGSAHFVNSRYYAVVIRLYFVIMRCLSRITRDLAAAWKRRRPMIDGIGNYATNSRTYLPNGPGCGLAFTRTSRGNRLPV